MTDPSDVDPQQTREWLESLEAVLQVDGPERARQLLAQVLNAAQRSQVAPAAGIQTPYVNTLPVSDDSLFPGDEDLEERIENIIRWNAAVMVAKANKKFDGLGGHISTFASSATLYEVGFQHFFRGRDDGTSGDQIFYQGHGAPGIYARTFIEGRFTEAHLNRFRREADRLNPGGLSSYPHARLMPDYWEFPTVSMGLGPMAAVYQARFNRYLAARDLGTGADSRVWAFLGDGETDEPEATGALTLAAREELDNLTFVINCNLQRLDGPVRGNGKIVQELEGLYRGAGWNVLKVLWGREWDPIFDQDDGALVQALGSTPDGEWQNFAEGDGAELRERFFQKREDIAHLIAGMSDDALGSLRPGGHDRRKVYAAMRRAVEHEGAPTVILSQSVKGFKVGDSFAGKNSTHQMKKMSAHQLSDMRDILEIPFTDEELESYPFYHPGPDSDEVRYVQEKRQSLGGSLPKRNHAKSARATVPGHDFYESFEAGSKAPASTTMALAQMVSRLLKDKELGPLVVPIIPDEARTFGMDPLFRQVGIYHPKGQTYEPVDKASLLYYRESEQGQVLEEGITEAGAMSSFLAAGTAYATHSVATIPIYTFYSMFGFQRIGDQAWAFGDARGRGFLMGATAGRTTLNGEGLQHEDGQSLLLSSTIPNLKSYDPAFAYELATLLDDGLRRMVQEGEDCFYYITVYNENYLQPPMPEGVRGGIAQGLYPYKRAEKEADITLFGSGSIMIQVLKAQELLAERYGVAADVWSATSYQQLRDDALRCERHNRLHPDKDSEVPYLLQVMDGNTGPVVAASDFMKAVPDMISRFMPCRFIPLGTDGYGMSDTREALRRHFEVDAESITFAALSALKDEGRFSLKDLVAARSDLGLDDPKINPLDV